MAQSYDDIISWYGKNIIQDANNRLVTDVQIDYWNKKSNPDHTHDDRYYTETEINNLLNGKSNTGHTHDDRYYTETEIDNKLKNISGSIPTTMTWENITGKPSTYPPSSHNHDTVYSKLGHTHTTADITDLKGILDNKANTYHTHVISDINSLQTILNGKAAAIHTHSISDITNLQASLNSKSDSNHNHDTVYSKLAHIHDDRYYTETEIDNLLKGLSGDINAITWNTLVGKPDTFPPSNHTHTTASITGLKTALASKSNIDHNHDTVYSKLGHNHDDRYYTETEMDGKIKAINDSISYINWQTLTGKPSTFPPSSHNHDDRYYTESEMDAKLNGKSNTGHNHDDRYYTESEMDNKLKSISDNVTNINWNTLKDKPSTFPPSSHTHSYLPLGGGTITGQIKGSFGGSWNAAREQAMIYNYNPTTTSYNPIIAGKTASGVWSVGTYPYAGEDLFFAYNSDSDYNAGNNGSTTIRLPVRGGTVALTSDIPTWDSIKPYTAFFGGISLDNNGAYIYGENNSGNILFRYKASAGDANYSWANIAGLVSAAYGNHTHSYLPLSGGTVSGPITFGSNSNGYITSQGSNDSNYGAGGFLNNLVISSWWGVSFTTHCAGQAYTNTTAVGIDCRNGIVKTNRLEIAYSEADSMLGPNGDLLSIVFTGGRQWGIGKKENSLQFGQFNGGNGDDGTIKFRIQNNWCYIDNGLTSMGIVNSTNSNAANMRINGEGKVYMCTSASKYKLNIQNIDKDEEYSYNILKLNPRQWYDKAETERYASYLTSEYTGDELDDELSNYYSTSEIKPSYGLIAEDVEKAGLKEFCEYREKDGKKEIDGIAYDRLPVLMIPILRDIVSCMNKILPCVKEGKKIEDEATLKQIEEIEKRFNSFKDEDIINTKYDPETSKIIG